MDSPRESFSRDKHASRGGEISRKPPGQEQTDESTPPEFFTKQVLD